MGPANEARLPPGYHLDRSDPDVWALRLPGGWVVEYFSAQGAIREAIERAAWGRLRGRRTISVKKTHDYIHYHRGYWSDGGKPALVTLNSEETGALLRAGARNVPLVRDPSNDPVGSSC
jgi:hypothetical protein